MDKTMLQMFFGTEQSPVAARRLTAGRLTAELVEGNLHGAPRRLADVDAINHLDVHYHNSVTNIGIRGDGLKEPFALLRVELFGIVQPAQFRRKSGL